MKIFHKTEIQRVILRHLGHLNCNWIRNYNTKLVKNTWILTNLRRTAVIFSKWLFFQKILDVMSHIIRSNAGKKINTIHKLFIQQKIVFNFVYFSSAQTLCSKYANASPRRKRILNCSGTVDDFLASIYHACVTLSGLYYKLDTLFSWLLSTIQNIMKEFNPDRNSNHKSSQLHLLM